MLRNSEIFRKLYQHCQSGDWAEIAALRWLGQVGLGATVGVVTLSVVMSSAHEELPEPNVTPRITIASIIPFLSDTGVSESANFHRLVPDVDFTASEAVQYRRQSLSAPATRAQPTKILPKAEPLMKYDFHQPRQTWAALSAKSRAALDRLVGDQTQLDLVLHGAAVGHATGAFLQRYVTEVRAGSASTCDIAISEFGMDVLQSASLEGPLDIVITGDFARHGPTDFQLQALDEISDYLHLKVSNITVLQHLSENGTSPQEICLGPLFPIRQVATAIAYPEKVSK